MLRIQVFFSQNLQTGIRGRVRMDLAGLFRETRTVSVRSAWHCRGPLSARITNCSERSPMVGSMEALPRLTVTWPAGVKGPGSKGLDGSAHALGHSSGRPACP